MSAKKPPRKTLRDEFAMAILAGRLVDVSSDDDIRIARSAYALADAMLRVRDDFWVGTPMSREKVSR